MTALLLKGHERMNPVERERADQAVRFYAQQIAEQQGTPFVQQESIALGLHKLVDECVRGLFKRDRKRARRVACKRGCAHCCHVQVDITEAEARLIVRALRDNGESISPAGIEHMRAQRDGDFDSMSVEQRRCVFLNSANECSVYEHRPMACRKYFALDNAAQCETAGANKGAMVLNFVDLNAECATAAAYLVQRNGPLPEMILDVL